MDKIIIKILYNLTDIQMQRRQTLSNSSYRLDQNSQYLTAESMKIKQIDILKQVKSSKIKCLNISDNMLTKLQNMHQFVNLQEIDVRNNYIKNGCELLVLNGLSRLYRVYVEGNPFLLEPLEEDVLQFLVQKETDIQILSGQDLDRIRDLEEGQLKVVFLQNYLKKINCHDQILSRRGNLNSSRRSLTNQQSTNHLIINKIMPQFYQILEDPKIKSKIKKQTIGIKREEQLTFENAVKKKKEKQQKQVNSLIKDILLLVDQQDQDKYQGSQHVVMRASRHNSESRDQGVQVDTICLDCEDHGRGEKEVWDSGSKFNDTQAFRKKINRIKNSMNFPHFDSEMQTNRNNYMQSTIKSPREVNYSPKSGTMQSPSINLYSPRNNQKVQSKNASPIRVPAFDNYYSFNNTTPMPFNSRSQGLKPVKTQSSKSKFETKKMQQKNLKQEKQIHEPTKRSEPKQFPEEPEQQQQQMTQKTAAELYEQYYAHLTKYNPTFALLYSQISTLSAEEKHVLIEALAKDHKNKTVELFMERNKVRTLKNIATQNASIHQQEKYQLKFKISELAQNFHLCRDYSEKLEKENKRISELIKVVSQDISDVKQENRKLKEALQKKNRQCSNLTKQLRNKTIDIQNFDVAEDVAQKISNEHNRRIKAEYLEKICKRAKQHTVIMKWRTKRQQKQRGKILTLTWSLLKKHLLMHVLAKMKASQYENQIARTAFQIWKQQIIESKELKGKQKALTNWIRGKNLKKLNSLTKEKGERRKERRLHIFWADHHLLKKYFYNLVKINKQMKLLLEKKFKQSIANHERRTVQKIFQKIKLMKSETKQFTQQSIKSIENNRKGALYKNLRRLLKAASIKQQRNRQISAIQRILFMNLGSQRKKQFYTIIKKQREQIMLMESLIKRKNKQRNFHVFVRNMNGRRKINQMKQKSSLANKILFWKRFKSKWNHYSKFLHQTKNLFKRINRKSIMNNLKIDHKINMIEDSNKTSRIRSFFQGMVKNMYETRLIQLQVRQRMEQQQTKQLLQKMRVLQQMQLQTIKAQHNKQLQMIQEDQIRKQIDYRNSIIELENNRKQLEDSIWVLKKQIDGMRERENIFFKEKDLIEEQVKIAEHGQQQMSQLNKNLQSELDGVNLKYQRVLELYTQAVIQLQKKQKSPGNSTFLQKERDRTVEKEKRPTGLVKNVGEFVSLRQRAV